MSAKIAKRFISYVAKAPRVEDTAISDAIRHYVDNSSSYEPMQCVQLVNNISATCDPFFWHTKDYTFDLKYTPYENELKKLYSQILYNYAGINLPYKADLGNVIISLLFSTIKMAMRKIVL
jgi:hypothetical protein